MTYPLRSVALAALMLLAFAARVPAADGPVVTEAWARATPPGAPMGAAYVTLVGGASRDSLKSVSTTRAEAVEMHTVEQRDGMMQMRQLAEIEVPAGQHVQLAPGGTHLMLIGLKSPLVAGERFDMDFMFERAGMQTVRVEVRAAVPQ